MSDKKNYKTPVDPDLEAQREYMKTVQSGGFDFSLVVADAFIRGIRDIGYKSTATALNEQIDNAIQANAQKAAVAFGFGPDSNSKPVALAVIDDGHGMDPTMIRVAITWGGTHRERDRSGFGRYGYGLGSSALSQGRRFSVYSAVEGGGWHRVTLDVDAIGNKQHPEHPKYIGEQDTVRVPDSEVAPLPDWVSDYISKHFPGGELTHGTIIVMEKLDNLDWSTSTALERHLMQEFGITYRNYLGRTTVEVNGKMVEPLDPLFVTPGYRFWDLDEDRAEALPPLEFEVKDEKTREGRGTVKVRYSVMPPTFARFPDDKLNSKTGRTNSRYNIMKDHNGIIILRNGRQIDVVSKFLGGSFQNNDRYWGVELDFPATLDEEFSITTSKQQVVLSERMSAILKQQGVDKTISYMRSQYSEAKARIETERENQERAKRASEQVMEEADKFRRKPEGNPGARQKDADEKLEQEIRRRARENAISIEESERQLLAEQEGRPYKVQDESMPGAPFFRIAPVGGQKVLYLNTAHRFYSHVYAAPGITTRLRSALEILLWTIGECELDAEPQSDKARFYLNERLAWSIGLETGLDLLDSVDSMIDGMVAADEAQEAAHNANISSASAGSLAA